MSVCVGDGDRLQSMGLCSVLCQWRHHTLTLSQFRIYLSPGCYDALFILFHMYGYMCVCVCMQGLPMSVMYDFWFVIYLSEPFMTIRLCYSYVHVQCSLHPFLSTHNFFSLSHLSRSIICALIINYFHPVSESTKRFCGWCSTVLFVNLLFHFVLFDFISFSFNQPVGQSARVHAQPDTQYTEWC